MEKLVYISGDGDYSVLNFEEYFEGKTLTELKKLGEPNAEGELILKGDEYGEIYLSIKNDIEIDEKAKDLLAVILSEADYDSSKHNGFTLIEQ